MNLWTTDRASLLRLAEDGVVDQDRRTGAIHLFDRSGARLAVAELEREEVERVGWFPHAFVRDDGSFLFQLGRGTDYADFGPDAARVGRVELPLTGMTPQPGRGTAWGRASEGIQRIELGGAVLRTIRRHEDGTWISGGSLAVASDGSLVLHSRADGEDAQRVSWYDPEGELEGTLMLPPGVGGRSLIAGHGWFALTGFGPELFLVDLETRAVGRAAVAEAEGPSWWFGASPDGRELWAIEIAGGLQPPVLRRFTVPGFD